MCRPLISAARGDRPVGPTPLSLRRWFHKSLLPTWMPTGLNQSTISLGFSQWWEASRHCLASRQYFHCLCLGLECYSLGLVFGLPCLGPTPITFFPLFSFSSRVCRTKLAAFNHSEIKQKLFHSFFHSFMQSNISGELGPQLQTYCPSVV